MSDQILRETLAIFRWSSEQAERAGLFYRGPADFVLQHGESFEPRPLPDEFEYGAPKSCYGNALVLAAARGLTYVEGYAMWLEGLPIPHAWNTDEEGRLIDVTWRSEEEESGRRVVMPGAIYLGVRFSCEQAWDAIWNGDACVLDDWVRGWPLLQEPWDPVRPFTQTPKRERKSRRAAPKSSPPVLGEGH